METRVAIPPLDVGLGRPRRPVDEIRRFLLDIERECHVEYFPQYSIEQILMDHSDSLQKRAKPDFSSPTRWSIPCPSGRMPTIR